MTAGCLDRIMQLLMQQSSQQHSEVEPRIALTDTLAPALHSRCCQGTAYATACYSITSGTQALPLIRSMKSERPQLLLLLLLLLLLQWESAVYQ